MKTVTHQLNTDTDCQDNNNKDTESQDTIRPRSNHVSHKERILTHQDTRTSNNLCGSTAVFEVLGI